jgi:IclR family transcriptional regulator, acetate operon repressor
MPKLSSAIEKALVVLETIAAERRPVTLAFLARATGMPKQTVHRVLRQLEDAKAVQRTYRPDSFILGQRLRDLAVIGIQASLATLPIRAEMEALAAAVGESANLGMLEGRSVLYLERVEVAWPLRFTLSPNDRLPAHTVSIGKLLMAHLPTPLRHDLLRSGTLERFTEFTITDPDELEREFACIVEQGYALNNQEYHLGLVGVAVPVRSSSGDVIAAVAIHGVMPRTSLESLSAHIPTMQRTAGRIARLLESQTIADAATESVLASVAG